MPCELTRVLTMMRELDRKSVELQQNVESMVTTIIQLQTQASTGLAKGLDKGDAATTVEALKATLHENQGLLMQWAEEKVQLALVGQELLLSHQRTLDEDVHNLTQFLSDTGQLEDYMPDEYHGVHPDVNVYESSDPPGSVARSGRRGGSTSRGAGYTTSADVYEEEPVASKQLQQQQAQKTSLRTNIPLTVNRQPSPQHVYEDEDSGKNTGTKRRRAAAMANTAAPPQETSRSGRRTAAGLATAAVMAVQYAEEEYAAVDHKAAAVAAAAAKQQAAAAAAAKQQQAALAQDPALLAPPVPLEPFIPGLAESSKEPQAARRKLEEKDIGNGLVGKVAEVFWEDGDGSAWYLVKVESVDLAAKTACVRYQSGEVEYNLSLVEAARDGIMLLV
ncbi:MAG: hypothetical protein ABGY24_14715 [bacterium]